MKKTSQNAIPKQKFLSVGLLWLVVDIPSVTPLQKTDFPSPRC